MSDINKVFLSGLVDSDPEFEEPSPGVRIARFSVSTGRRVFRDADAWDVERLSHRVVARGGWTETVEYAVAKGRPVTVEGRIGRDGAGRTEIVVSGREGNLQTYPPYGEVPPGPDIDDEIPY